MIIVMDLSLIVETVILKQLLTLCVVLDKWFSYRGFSVGVSHGGLGRDIITMKEAIMFVFKFSPLVKLINSTQKT